MLHDTDWGSVLSNIAQSAAQVVPQVLVQQQQAKLQRQALQLDLTRAQQGQYPVATSVYAPAPQFQTYPAPAQSGGFRPPSISEGSLFPAAGGGGSIPWVPLALAGLGVVLLLVLRK